MSGNYHFGDNFVQIGDNNIGAIKNQGPSDPLGEVVSLVALLHDHVSTDDRRVIDEAMEVIRTEHPEKGALRRALSSIAGIAIIVGDVGAPVIEAIRRVSAALGL